MKLSMYEWKIARLLLFSWSDNTLCPQFLWQGIGHLILHWQLKHTEDSTLVAFIVTFRKNPLNAMVASLEVFCVFVVALQMFFFPTLFCSFTIMLLVLTLFYWSPWFSGIYDFQHFWQILSNFLIKSFSSYYFSFSLNHISNLCSDFSFYLPYLNWPFTFFIFVSLCWFMGDFLSPIFCPLSV